MNQAALETFLAIVETGNLNRAAERLHVTQSTVSARLNGLEEDLGQALFHRRKSGAALTSAGFKFERYAKLMTDLWRQARQETSLPEQVASVLNLGCHHELWPGLGARVFIQARQQWSTTALSVWSGSQAEQIRWLYNGLVDVAFCYAAEWREGFTVVPLKKDELILVSTSMNSAQRWDTDYIYVDYGEAFRRDHAATYPEADTPMTVISSPAWAMDYLERFGGAAYLPLRLVNTSLSENQWSRVDGAPIFQRDIYLVVSNSVSANRPEVVHWLAEACEAGNDTAVS